MYREKATKKSNEKEKWQSFFDLIEFTWLVYAIILG